MHLQITHQDGAARAGLLHSRRGVIPTPVFMPVGTAGSVKALDAPDLTALDAKIILANTYHLALRPGTDVVRGLGGLHGFSGFSGAFLTDSGGFQAFSLAKNARFSEEGIAFKSHIDGSSHLFTPRSVLDFQYDLNSEIMMVLDELIALPAKPQRVRLAVDRTLKWAREALAYHRARSAPSDQALFGIIQGGTDFAQRRRCAEELATLDFEGLAIGGLSVGEENALMYEVVERTVPFTDPARPRYLMGVGSPQDLLECVERGVDMFDCVMPTRNARNGTIFTRQGRFNIRRAEFINEHEPLEPGCACHSCAHFSRGYLNHLFRTGELSFFRLASIHNVHFYLRLMSQAREAIVAGTFAEFKRGFLGEFI